jgi:hypothetical protein
MDDKLMPQRLERPLTADISGALQALLYPELGNANLNLGNPARNPAIPANFHSSTM